MSICFLNLLILLNLVNLTVDIFSNKSWPKYRKVFRALPEFKDCLNAFLNHAFSTIAFDGTIYCPCKLWPNHYVHGRDIVYEHLKLNGMDKCYAQIDGFTMEKLNKINLIKQLLTFMSVRKQVGIIICKTCQKMLLVFIVLIELGAKHNTKMGQMQKQRPF